MLIMVMHRVPELSNISDAPKRLHNLLIEMPSCYYKLIQNTAFLFIKRMRRKSVVNFHILNSFIFLNIKEH